MKVKVDKNLCIGCGLCASTCSTVYEMENDELAHAIEDDVPTEYEDAAKEAVENCPVDAITEE